MVAVAVGTVLSTLLLAGQPQPFEFRWTFMPTYSMFRTVVLHPPSNATHFTLSLTSNLTSEIPINSTSGPMSLINNTVGFNWEVQPLRAPGEYTLSLSCLSADARVVLPSTRACSVHATPPSRPRIPTGPTASTARRR